MAIVLKPKKSETASAVPTTSDLAVGEICVNVADRKIYTRKSNNSIVVVGSHIETDVGGTSVGGDVTGTVSDIQIGSNTITATELADNSVGITELNVSDGSAGQYLTTNGSGTLSFATDSTNVGGTSVGGDVTGTVSNIQIATNTVGITELNVSDGSAGQYLTTNGSGTLSFATDSTNVSGTAVGGDLSGTVSNAQIATNTVGITELNVSDGTNGQILKTNGSGTLSFTDSGATIQQATSKAVTMAIALG
jgi:sporulation protein YlmC with PRC-barrel domain